MHINKNVRACVRANEHACKQACNTHTLHYIDYIHCIPI